MSVAIVGGSFLLAFIAEELAPLRRRREPKLRRTIRNLTTGGISFAFLSLLQLPLLLPVARWTEENGIGLLNAIELSRALEIALAVILLDYTLWWWHWANHMVPFFWRFHLVHHVDRDLDASTALRFHFGELILSIGYRAIQIAVLGADPLSLSIWQAVLFVSILFHHANWRLPFAIERFLVRVIVTPRMHGIHHSTVRSETNSNWSSLFSAWDYLHGTMLLNVPHEAIEIGVPAYRDPHEVTIGKLLALPFRRQRLDWQAETSRTTDEMRRRLLSA